MANELIIIDKIEKRLREKNPIKVFPLTPTHRNELRELRDKNVGNLRNTLGNIKTLKQTEYYEKYKLEIIKEFEGQEKICDELNKDWSHMVDKIQTIITERRQFEEKKLELLASGHSIQKGYDAISELRETKDWNRRFYLNKKSMSESIANDEFKKKYGDSFEKVTEQIDDIHTKYEEAINFGDLEIVKELYYIMKGADSLFEKINKIKV